MLTQTVLGRPLRGEITTGKVLVGVGLAALATFAAVSVAGTARDRRWLRR